MRTIQQAGKELKSLSYQVQDVINDSAGEFGRRERWVFFIKHIPNDYNLRELADECFDLLTDDQKGQFLARANKGKPSFEPEDLVKTERVFSDKEVW